jgi:hypothetical protein
MISEVIGAMPDVREAVGPCLRIAAAYRAQIAETDPRLWRSFEIYYRQHVRNHLRAGEVRHWDAALRISE